jgi:hypothetical protein
MLRIAASDPRGGSGCGLIAMRALLSKGRGGNGCGLIAMCGVAGARTGPA